MFFSLFLYIDKVWSFIKLSRFSITLISFPPKFKYSNLGRFKFYILLILLFERSYFEWEYEKNEIRVMLDLYIILILLLLLFYFKRYSEISIMYNSLKIQFYLYNSTE